MLHAVPEVVEAVLECRANVRVHVVWQGLDDLVDLLEVGVAGPLEDVLARARGAVVEPRLDTVQLRVQRRGRGRGDRLALVVAPAAGGHQGERQERECQDTRGHCPV